MNCCPCFVTVFKNHNVYIIKGMCFSLYMYCVCGYDQLDTPAVLGLISSVWLLISFSISLSLFLCLGLSLSFSISLCLSFLSVWSTLVNKNICKYWFWSSDKVLYLMTLNTFYYSSVGVGHIQLNRKPAAAIVWASLFYRQQWIFYTHYPIDRIIHTTSFDIPDAEEIWSWDPSVPSKCSTNWAKSHLATLREKLNSSVCNSLCANH